MKKLQIKFKLYYYYIDLIVKQFSIFATFAFKLIEFSMVIFFQLINWQKQVEAYARENGCIFLETSAKTGHNVVEIFTEIAKKLPQQS